VLVEQKMAVLEYSHQSLQQLYQTNIGHMKVKLLIYKTQRMGLISSQLVRTELYLFSWSPKVKKKMKVSGVKWFKKIIKQKIEFQKVITQDATLSMTAYQTSS
jgi:hypothetical protein